MQITPTVRLRVSRDRAALWTPTTTYVISGRCVETDPGSHTVVVNDVIHQYSCREIWGILKTHGVTPTHTANTWLTHFSAYDGKPEPAEHSLFD